MSWCNEEIRELVRCIQRMTTYTTIGFKKIPSVAGLMSKPRSKPFRDSPYSVSYPLWYALYRGPFLIDFIIPHTLAMKSWQERRPTWLSSTTCSDKIQWFHIDMLTDRWTRMDSSHRPSRLFGYENAFLLSEERASGVQDNNSNLWQSKDV